jgi:hypothetical protein
MCRDGVKGERGGERERKRARQKERPAEEMSKKREKREERSETHQRRPEGERLLRREAARGAAGADGVSNPRADEGQ